MQSKFLKMFFLGAVLLGAGQTFAMCLDNRHPSVQDEFATSFAVIEGRVLREKNLTEDPSDPSGITATVYDVRVTRKLKGLVGRTIQVKSENTSSRFPMELGSSYVLFLIRDKNSNFVDGCGNSVRLSEARNVLSIIKSENVK